MSFILIFQAYRRLIEKAKHVLRQIPVQAITSYSTIPSKNWVTACRLTLPLMCASSFLALCMLACDFVRCTCGHFLTTNLVSQSLHQILFDRSIASQKCIQQTQGEVRDCFAVAICLSHVRQKVTRLSLHGSSNEGQNCEAILLLSCELILRW